MATYSLTGCGPGWLLVVCLLLVQLVPNTEAAYFYVEEGNEKCFEENILQHQVLKMTYSMHDKEVLDSGNKETASECKITIKSPTGQAVKEHALVTDNHQ